MKKVMLGLFVLMIMWVSPVWAGGPVVLMGIDAEDEGPGGHGPIANYVSVVNSILVQASNGGTGILVIGGGKAEDHVTSFWNAIDDALPAHPVTYVNGATNITNQSFGGFAMIAVVSDFANVPSGGLTQLELNALNGRSADVAAHVNGGGGLLGFSQCDLNNAYAYLGGIGTFSCGGVDYDTITPTTDGSAIGITSDLSICCWHESYPSFPSFLKVLATATSFEGTTIPGGHVAAIGGAEVVIPIPVITTVVADLNFPFGVVEGSVYIADRNNHVVKKLSGGVLTVVAGTGEAGYNGDGIAATTAQLNSPTGVAIANGNLYIADSGNHIIRKVSGGTITTVAGIPQKNGLAINGGPATQTTLFGPRGVATDGAGSIYIADTMNQQIRKVVNPGTMGAIITAVAGAAGETGNDDGLVATARLNSPLGVAVNSSGSVVVIADEGNDLVRVVTGGVVDTVEAGALNSPSGVALAADGTLYIADTDNHRIQRVSGESVTTVAGTGTPGDSGDNGPATAAQLNHPVGVAVDASGEILYIADLINNKIRKVDFTP